jgi:thioredoxin reductase
LIYDVVIVGGGPAGLSAALALGRARKRVLLCDFGPRRNVAAEHIHNFVTRDGTPPHEFRRIAREQLATYPNVELRETGVEAISGARGAFDVSVGAESVIARRILLCTGMLDDVLPIEGFGALWGQAIFQCPYCHGWEAQDKRWGYLARAAEPGHLLPFALQARGWTHDLTVFVDKTFAIADETRAQLQSAGIRLELSPVVRLATNDRGLDHIVLADDSRLRCDVLFVHPPQRQVALVQALGLELDEAGFVKIDPMKRETSEPGIYAGGDLITPMQGALFGAAAGTQAAAMLNLELTMELALSGGL